MVNAKKNTAQTKRAWVVALLAVLIVAGGGVILYILQHEQNKVINPGAYYGNSADGFSANVDKDAHIGVVNAVTKNQVANAFGDDVSVGDFKESGTVRLGTTRSETISTKVSSEAGEVTFDVDARRYESEGDVRKANVFMGAEDKPVRGVGDAAHYLFPYAQQYAKEQQAILLVRSGKVVYRFGITQSSDSLIYDKAKCREILLEIAKNAQLDVVK